MKGLLIGGLGASLFFGLAGVLAKTTSGTGIGISGYLFFMGVAYMVVATLTFTSPNLSLNGALLASMVGACQAIGMALVLYAVVSFGSPMSQLAPLYNTNTLVAVILSLVIFSEWQSVNVTKVMIGSLLIVIGSTLVATK